MTAKSNESMDNQLVGVETPETPAANTNVSGEADVPSKTKATDGFQTPSKKHRVCAAASQETPTAMEGVIVTNNPYLPLTSLGTTRSQGTSPKKSPTSESPRKKKTKVNPAFMQAMDDAFTKQQEALDSGLDKKLPGKVDVGVSAAASQETATAMEGVIVTNNPYLPLTSLGTTRSRGTSPKKSPTSESPQKKKTKVNPAFMQAMDDAFTKQQEALDSGLDKKLPGKVDVGVSIIGRFNGAVKAVVAATGLGTDEAIQDEHVTGERNWQDSWENSSDSDK
jgi:hypothetical protein